MSKLDSRKNTGIKSPIISERDPKSEQSLTKNRTQSLTMKRSVQQPRITANNTTYDDLTAAANSIDEQGKLIAQTDDSLCLVSEVLPSIEAEPKIVRPNVIHLPKIQSMHDCIE